MNIYQGLLFLQGFRVLPEDLNHGAVVADERRGTTPPATEPSNLAGAAPVAGTTT